MNTTTTPNRLKLAAIFIYEYRHSNLAEQMPFAKYGFHIYRQDEWINMLEINLLHYVHTKKTQIEPEIEFDKKLYEGESLCLVAKKNR